MTGRVEYNSTNISPGVGGVLELTGDNLKAGEHIDVDLNPPFTDGQTYHLNIYVFDLAGNPCSDCGDLDFITYDFFF